MKLNEIIKGIETEFTPLAWDRVKLKMMPYLMEKGYDASLSSDDLEIDQEMTSKIDSILKEMYGTGLQF